MTTAIAAICAPSPSPSARKPAKPSAWFPRPLPSRLLS
jgi:hypothetical protein